MTTEEQLAQAERERDSSKRQLDRLQDAIVEAVVQRIEPRMSRHPVTVVQHAGSIIARIGEAMACQFEDGDDLLEAVKELVRECDEARASGADAYRRGAEAMREACQEWCRAWENDGEAIADALADLRVDE